MIVIQNVTQYYGAKAALRDVSLEVWPGELLAVMGPNGSGKSTLLQVAAGLLWPLEGCVEINGLKRRSSVVNELAIRRKTVYLPAEPWLPKASTGREFLIAVGRLYGHDDKRLLAHAEKLLTLFNMNDIGDTATAAYSTGQQKKIALCSAFITEAPVLILDEPFSGGLDPSGILALRKVLARLAERTDVTVLMATPVPELVEQLANRVAVMEDRQIKAVDTPEALRRKAGGDGSLQDALEHIVNPHTDEHVDEYVREWGR